MARFYEEYKLLISTETSYKDGTPHALFTGTDYCTQHMSAEVKFDYQKVYDREDTYHDVVGFYHTHPSGMQNMSGIDVETMRQWVTCLGKSLICIIETDESLNAWMFVKDDNAEGGITVKDIQANTGNDVNYDIWFDSAVSFWHPADFLLNGEHYSEMPDQNNEETGEVKQAISELQENQDNMITGFNTLIDTIQSLIQTITKDEDDEQDE